MTMAETSDLLTSLLSGVFKNVASGTGDALTKLLLNQINPGRAARFETLPPTPAGQAQTDLFGRLQAQEPAFAALRTQAQTSPADVTATTVSGIPPFP